jgi:DNA-binding MarR family transcriptional regulator
VTGAQARAERFAEFFHAAYLTFHRRDRPRSGLPGASRAVLEHLALAGPLTIGEAAAHMCRAQSVISEIVTHLERDGLLERQNDPADRRRTLIWLTPGGHGALRRDREVLDVGLLACAMARLPPGQADALNDAIRALIQGAQSDGVEPTEEKVMTTTSSCDSCGMPIESGRYCGYCTDESGELQSFEQRFARMAAWQARRDPAASQQDIERQVLDYMATMPAWRDHPRVQAP